MIISNVGMPQFCWECPLSFWVNVPRGEWISDDHVTQGLLSLVGPCVPHTDNRHRHMQGHQETFVDGRVLLCPSLLDFHGFSLSVCVQGQGCTWCDVHTHASPVLHFNDLRVVYEDSHSTTKSNQSHSA